MFGCAVSLKGPLVVFCHTSQGQNLYIKVKYNNLTSDKCNTSFWRDLD